MKYLYVALFGVSVYAPSVSAGITAFDFVGVENSAGAPALDGFTTTDVRIDFDSRWTGSQMLIVLEQGSIYQNAAVPGAGPPSLTLQSIDPAATYDSYVTLNATSSDELNANLLAFGGAVDLGGSRLIQFDNAGVNSAWVYQPAQPFDTFFLPFEDQQDFLISRISLSNDAKGTFTVLATAGGFISTTGGDLDSLTSIDSILADFQTISDTSDPNAPLLVQGVIDGGAFVVPEPATAGLFTLGLTCLTRRRTR
ncbi:MAG: PEP-CTERM sorting domain-containing protein [Planctomycetota bacterium]